MPTVQQKVTDLYKSNLSLSNNKKTKHILDKYDTQMGADSSGNQKSFAAVLESQMKKKNMAI